MKITFYLQILVVLFSFEQAFGQGVTQPGVGPVDKDEYDLDGTKLTTEKICELILVRSQKLIKSICLEFEKDCEKVSYKQLGKILDDVILKKTLGKKEKINSDFCPDCASKQAEMENNYSDLKANLERDLKKSCEPSKQDELKKTIEKLDQILAP